VYTNGFDSEFRKFFAAIAAFSSVPFVTISIYALMARDHEKDIIEKESYEELLKITCLVYILLQSEVFGCYYTFILFENVLDEMI